MAVGVGKGGPSALTQMPRSVLLPPPRLTGLEESAWGDDEAGADHNYYNSIPGKEPPLGGLVDSRLAVTQPCALATLGGLGQVSSRGARRDMELSSGWVEKWPGTFQGHHGSLAGNVPGMERCPWLALGHGPLWSR